MTDAAVLAALTSAVMHATWSALAYRFDDPAVGFALLFMVTAAIGVPLVVVSDPLDRAALPYLVPSIVVHIGYTFALMHANTISEFSQLYPISRGLAPVLVTGFAIVTPGLTGTPVEFELLCGVTLVIVGVVLTAAGRLGGRLDLDRRAMVSAIVIACLIAVYTILDGLAVRQAGSPFSYMGWLAVLQGALTAGCLLVTREVRGRVRRAPKTVAVVGGLLSVGSYSSTIWAQSQGSLAAVAALRETSILFASAIGILVFKERGARFKMVSAVLIVTGVIVIQR